MAHLHSLSSASAVNARFGKLFGLYREDLQDWEGIALIEGLESFLDRRIFKDEAVALLGDAAIRLYQASMIRLCIAKRAVLLPPVRANLDVATDIVQCQASWIALDEAEKVKEEARTRYELLHSFRTFVAEGVLH